MPNPTDKTWASFWMAHYFNLNWRGITPLLEIWAKTKEPIHYHINTEKREIHFSNRLTEPLFLLPPNHYKFYSPLTWSLTIAEENNETRSCYNIFKDNGKPFFHVDRSKLLTLYVPGSYTTKTSAMFRQPERKWMNILSSKLNASALPSLNLIAPITCETFFFFLFDILWTQVEN